MIAADVAMKDLIETIFVKEGKVKERKKKEKKREIYLYKEARNKHLVNLNIKILL